MHHKAQIFKSSVETLSLFEETGAEGVEGQANQVGGKRGEVHGCAFYLAKPHDLIKRHVESIDVNPDHTAEWELRVDLELPTNPASFLGNPDADGKCHFLFPLAYLRKAEARPSFSVRDEYGTALSVPIRQECDRISSTAAAEAAISLHAREGLPPAPFSTAALAQVLRAIAADKPLDSSMVLEELLRQMGLAGRHEGSQPEQPGPTGEAWKRAGLTDVLHMLVEHSLIWVPLHGRPGERRSVVIGQRIELVRRAFVRWIFCDVDLLKKRCLHPFRTRRLRDPDSLLEVGEKKYCRRARRISFSVLAERLGQPIGWTPCEFEIPTIYAKRCRSYHLEIHCPPGRTPRDLRPAKGSPLAEPGEEVVASADGKGSRGRTVLTTRTARHDRPGGNLARIWFRLSLGIGDSSFPMLWFLTGVITATMLWVLADKNPSLGNSSAEIATAILLIVPVLVAALAIGGGSEGLIAGWMGGARLLLLITGLSAVAAAAVVAGERPFDLNADWDWTICAIMATIATIPLGTSWLLSSRFIWSQMKKLRSWRLQRRALTGFALFAGAGIAALIWIEDSPVWAALIAAYLLVLAIFVSALANNRAAMPIGESRRNVVFSCLIAGLTCLVLACIELRSAIDPGPGPQAKVEIAALLLIAFSLWTGRGLKTGIDWFTTAKPRELHVSPQLGKAMLAREAVDELIVLIDREHQADREEASKGEQPPTIETTPGLVPKVHASSAE